MGSPFVAAFARLGRHEQIVKAHDAAIMRDCPACPSKRGSPCLNEYDIPDEQAPNAPQFHVARVLEGLDAMGVLVLG